MKVFLERHHTKIVGSLSCFDRVIFRGHSGLGYGKALEGFLDRQRVLYRDFATFAPWIAQQVKEAALATAQRSGRLYQYVNERRSKEAMAREIAQREGITRGLICVLACLELCRSFRMVPGDGKPRLESGLRKST